MSSVRWLWLVNLQVSLLCVQEMQGMCLTFCICCLSFMREADSLDLLHTISKAKSMVMQTLAPSVPDEAGCWPAVAQQLSSRSSR